MFSQKYKEDQVNRLFNSMKQLDRVEFQNKLIQQNQKNLYSKMLQSTFLILSFISSSFLIYFSASFSHLLSLGFYSEVHRQAGITFIILSMITYVIFLVITLLRISESDRTKKHNDEQLDFILNKK